MYGLENWTLNETTTALLESFRELEETFKTHYTDNILGCGNQGNVRDIKKEVHKVYKIDKQMVLEKCGTAYRSLAVVTTDDRIGCIPLWELILDCGERCEEDSVDGKLGVYATDVLEKTAPIHMSP